MATTDNLSITLVEQSQSQKEVTVNDAIVLLDALINTGVIDKDLTTPPVSPASGDLYIVASGATGAWAGQDNNLALYNQTWRFITPNEGLTLWLNDEDDAYVFDGTAWQTTAISSLQNLTMLGINASADATNKLTVASSAILFNNIGNGVQVKLNKASTGDTASFLYQTNWSGRAEFGTTGDDDFHIKVSPDGGTWYESFVIDKDTGDVDFKQNITQNGNPISGSGGVNKNYLINGGFTVAQRGTSFVSVAGGSYTLDRWLHNNNGTGYVRNVSRQKFSIGQTAVSGNPESYMRLEKTTAGAGETWENTSQKIEDLSQFSSETIMLSFWAKANAALTINSDFELNYGSGGGATEWGGGQSNSITTVWQKFTHTVTIGNLASKTFGTNDYLGVIFNTPSAGATWTIEIANVKLEKGGNATDFIPRQPAEELALCQRYFEKSYNIEITPGTASQYNGVALSFAHDAWTLQNAIREYKVKKRAEPTVTIYSPSTGLTGRAYDYIGAADVTGISVMEGGEGSFRQSGNGNYIAGRYYSMQFTANAEL